MITNSCPFDAVVFAQPVQHFLGLHTLILCYSDYSLLYALSYNAYSRYDMRIGMALKGNQSIYAHLRLVGEYPSRSKFTHLTQMWNFFVSNLLKLDIPPVSFHELFGFSMLSEVYSVGSLPGFVLRLLTLRLSTVFFALSFEALNASQLSNSQEY